MDYFQMVPDRVCLRGIQNFSGVSLIPKKLHSDQI